MIVAQLVDFKGRALNGDALEFTNNKGCPLSLRVLGKGLISLTHCQTECPLRFRDLKHGATVTTESINIFRDIDGSEYYYEYTLYRLLVKPFCKP